MKNFLKYLLASIIGVLIASLLMFLILLGIISGSTKDQVPDLKANSILVAELDKTISERKNDMPFANFSPTSLQSEGSQGLDDIVRDIKRAKNDDRIKCLFLKLTDVNAGMASLEEIRTAIIDFKESGKPVIAQSDSYGQKTYYLASVADTIFLTPEGSVTFLGMRAEVNFYKKALDKLGIDVQILRHGSYKGAVEPFMRQDLSKENREQIESFIGAIWNHVTGEISKSRSIPVEELNRYADELMIRTDKDALQYRLVDKLAYYDEVLACLKGITGTSLDDDLESISLAKYNLVPEKEKAEPTRDKIAVVYAYGSVVDGDDGEGTISSERISKAIRKARTDKSVKAIVFRVNSGGGSALASEVIYREIKLASEVKPVVASLGDVAGSGGYYIVCAADTIICSPTTITGSIGVFGMIPNAEKLLEDKIGITTDVVRTNKHADVMTIFRPLDQQEKDYITAGIEQIYSTFVGHVAEGRSMSFEAVDAIGGGRVWSGTDGKDKGLVDLFGGLDYSIEVAAEMAGIENYHIKALPELEDPFTQLMNQLSGSASVRMLRNSLGEEYRYIEFFNQIRNQSGIQALMPFTINIY